jgi:hypothetical protein
LGYLDVAAPRLSISPDSSHSSFFPSGAPPSDVLGSG